MLIQLFIKEKNPCFVYISDKTGNNIQTTDLKNHFRVFFFPLPFSVWLCLISIPDPFPVLFELSTNLAGCLCKVVRTFMSFGQFFNVKSDFFFLFLNQLSVFHLSCFENHDGYNLCFLKKLRKKKYEKNI